MNAKDKFNTLAKVGRQLASLHMLYTSSCEFVDAGLNDPKVGKKLEDAYKAVYKQMEIYRKQYQAQQKKR